MKTVSRSAQLFGSIALALYFMGCNQFDASRTPTASSQTASGVSTSTPARPQLYISDNQSNFSLELQNSSKLSAQTLYFAESSSGDREEPFVAVMLGEEESKLFKMISISNAESGAVLSDVNCTEKMSEMSAKYCVLSLAGLLERKNCGFSLSKSYHSLKKGKYRLSLTAVDQSLQNVEFEIQDSCGESAVASQYKVPGTPGRSIASASNAPMMEHAAESPYRWAWSAMAIVIILLTVGTLDFKKSKTKN